MSRSASRTFFLEDDLLGGLDVDAAEAGVVDLDAELVTQFAGIVELLGVAEADLDDGVADLIDHVLVLVDLDLAVAFVVAGLVLALDAELLAGRDQEGLLDGADDDFFFDAPVFAELLDDPAQF